MKLGIVGAGPGGYVAAIRAAQLGFETWVFERDRVGGVCLNVGCIPTKALLSATKIGWEASGASKMGVKAAVEYDLEALDRWRQAAVERLVKGVEHLFKRWGVKLVRTEVQVKGKRVEWAEGSLEPDALIIATGSRPFELPGLPFDEERVITSTEALSVKEVPQSLVIVGGGVIGLELATVYARLGVKVSIVEMTEGLLPGFDGDLRRTALRLMRELGVKVYLKHKAVGLSDNGLVCETPKGEAEIEGEKVLVAVGRVPNTEALEGFELAGRFVKVNERWETSVPGVYAIGDVVGPPLLAHKASAEGLAVVESLAGKQRRFRFIPSVVYTEPEMASVGATEEELKERGLPYSARKFPYLANGRAVAAGATTGFVKVLVGEGEEILGIHIVGPTASDMIAEATLAMEAGIKARELAEVVHPHPTFSEALMEAAEPTPLHLAPFK